MMAIALAEKLPEDPLFACEDATPAYFFCDSSSEKHRTAASVLRGLVYQTLQKHPPSLGPLVSKYRGHKDKLFSSFDALWSVLMEIGNSSGLKLYCIIDALDECDDEAIACNTGLSMLIWQDPNSKFRDATTPFSN